MYLHLTKTLKSLHSSWAQLIQFRVKPRRTKTYLVEQLTGSIIITIPVIGGGDYNNNNI